MAADQMTIQPVGEPQRFFQIDRIAGNIQPMCAAQGFTGDIDGKASLFKCSDSQAGAIDSNTVANGDIRQIQFTGIDIDTYRILFRMDVSDIANCFDNSCEHVFPGFE